VRIFIVLLVGLLVTASYAEEIQLFNGKDLSNWVWVPEKGDSKIEDLWSVKDGVLQCKGQPIGYIRTKEDYTSFVLKLEWRFSKPGNGGVLLRVQAPDEVWPKSIEAQLQHKEAGDIWNIGKFPMKVDPARSEDRRTKKLKPSNEKPIGEWNQYQITLDGKNLKLVVNGEVQNEATDCEVVPGKIALQSEGGAIEFRNIVLTPIHKESSAK
jgi:hypothetical protein